MSQFHNEYDFDDELISERIPVIHVPNFQPLISSRRHLNKLDNQTLRNIELFLQQSKNKQIQRIKQLKNKQKFIGQQVQKQQIKKQQKIKQIQQQQKQKTLKQCTFKPNINTKGQKRALAQFLETQNQHLKKVQAKKRNLKISIQSQKQKQSFHPKINQNASKSRKNSQPIYQRLYALKDKQNIVYNNNIEQYNLQNTFKPVISQKSKKISRNAPIQTLLYGDALRRQQKSKQILYTQSSQPYSIKQKPINLTNQKYAAQKFIKQYFNILSQLNINLSINHQIDYIMFNEILKNMGFIKEDEDGDDGVSVYERSLVHDAYEKIQKYTVNARNVCMFLLALIGIYHVNLTNFGDQQQQSDPNKQYNLNQTQGRKLQKYFDTLFRNRLNCQHTKKPAQSSLSSLDPNYSFQPKINKNSQHLAQKHRSLMLQQANLLLQNYPELQYSIPKDGIISHTDLLVLNKLAKQIQIKKKREQIQSKGMEQCTFKPTTLSSVQQNTLNSSKISNFDSKLGEKKSFQLYNYHKNQQSKKQSLQVSRQVQDPECTFVPNLKKDKVKAIPTYAKKIDETLYRMHKGRQQKEEKTKFLQRGEKVGQSALSSHYSSNGNILGSRMSFNQNMNMTMNGSNYNSVNSKVNIKNIKNSHYYHNNHINNNNNDSIQQSCNHQHQHQQQQQQYSPSHSQQTQPSPTLILDVNLGDQTSRINLYKQDQNRLNQVAHEFALKHGLDQESQQKLLEMLEIQLGAVLGKIQEDQELEDVQ